MKQYLQLVSFLQMSAASDLQTCYTQCLQTTSASATSINVMLVDGSTDSLWQGTQQWYDSKTAEFNALFPAISVELSHVPYEDMVTQAEEDVQHGTNQYHAYLVPLLNSNGGTSRLAEDLMDMSVFTVDNVNNIQWNTIGQFFRSHSALYEGKVLTLPLSGDFLSMYYRRDLFEAYGLAVPRTLEEYVVASQTLNGTDLNGDGEPDYGSCFPHAGEFAAEYFLIWVAQVLQYRGTSQGSPFDTQTLSPLLENTAVQEAIQLWKEVAGPPETTRGTTTLEHINFWLTGRCAMTLGFTFFYTINQSTALDEITGVAVMPGSERVWWREGSEMIKCNTTFCRHATQYPDGTVVNHAPMGQSYMDGAINGWVEMDKQLAAFTYFTWLMNDANMLEAVVNPPSWPNSFGGSFVKPSLLVPSVWTPYGWSDPAVSMVCATATSNMNHPNAHIGLRLPNAQEYWDVSEELLIEFWRGTGDFADLDSEVGARVFSARLTAALQEVTDRGDREALVVTYQKSLNIYVQEQTWANEGSGEVFPRWSVYAIVGMFGFAAILISSYTLYWLISTLVQRHKLRTQQREEWESIVGEAETYATTLGCPLALVRATDFFDLGCMTHFEAIRDAHKLRVLDTIEKVTEFKRKFFIVFLSQQYLALTAPATNSMLFETMCAAARSAAAIANVSLDKIFLWVDFCSIPQEHMATRELYLAAIPTYAMLCDIFVIIAPSPMDDDFGSWMSAHFRGGWCNAEFLARLVASGVHNLFFCDSCDGFLQEVSLEMVQTIDINVFSGEFRCCSVQHVGHELCDREKLRTPILGVYAHYPRTLMSTDAAKVNVVEMEREKERLLPKFFDFVQGVDETTTTTQTRELFGPLPEILEKRIKESLTKQNAQALQPRTAPTSNPGRSQRDMLCEEEAGVASTESPDLPMDDVAPKPSKHESGQGSIMTADINSTHVSQMYESEDWVVTDLDALSECHCHCCAGQAVPARELVLKLTGFQIPQPGWRKMRFCLRMH